MGWLRASKTYGLLQATLGRRAENKNKQIEETEKGLGRYQATLGRRAENKNKQIEETEKGLGRYQTTFSLEQERELVEYLLHLESMLFGLTCDDVRKLAYQLAVRNSVCHYSV
ncbi:hypothetical protein QE152_g5609 [Popillia japonica]|uniref:Uncharacterized protein n=1 Tax=Popillia japonica TaxID=7064 RepID=A0AAW1MMD3_POPJA